jgi:hypothetical protein
MTFRCIGCRPTWIGFSLSVEISDPGVTMQSEVSITHYWRVSKLAIVQAEARGRVDEWLIAERVAHERAFLAMLERRCAARNARLHVGRTKLVVIREAIRSECSPAIIGASAV